ncbi:site-2 protease family protein [Candidatus Woesebacteria bacterium]|nr:site-2 protease family protein [Candidatus Woesebacteria bacterium]
MIGSIIVFLIVLSILVLVHELGHFIMARRAGVLVEEFGFGLPPRVFGKKIGETLYSINALPFGGFVKLHGENSEEKIAFPKRAFLKKSKKTRTGIIVAGVVMNFLLAIVSFAIVYYFSGIPKETGKVKVLDIAPGSPAQTAGIIVGDVVIKVDGKEVTKVDEFVSLVEEKKGRRVVIEFESKKLTVIPRESPPEGEGPLGVTISTTEIYYPPKWQRPFVGAFYGFKEALFWGKTVTLGFWNLITQLFGGKVPGDLAGPVGIFAITSAAAKVGVIALINFIGILSVNLAILNILPFPALDGGRLLFIGIEKIIGKKVLPKIESMVHTVGMVILLLLLLAITAHDIRRVISAGGFAGFLNSIR